MLISTQKSSAYKLPSGRGANVRETKALTSQDIALLDSGPTAPIDPNKCNARSAAAGRVILPL
eukprot:9316128-Pyramimonas_sp.AAC.1